MAKCGKHMPCMFTFYCLLQRCMDFKVPKSKYQVGLKWSFISESIVIEETQKKKIVQIYRFFNWPGYRAHRCICITYPSIVIIPYIVTKTCKIHEKNEIGIEKKSATTTKNICTIIHQKGNAPNYKSYWVFGAISQEHKMIPKKVDPNESGKVEIYEAFYRFFSQTRPAWFSSTRLIVLFKYGW